MKGLKIYVYSLSLLLFSTVLSFGQSAENYLGQPYSSVELTTFRNSFVTEKPSEKFLPYLKSFKIDYLSDGVAMEYNSNISLYRISLFDSGYSYKAFNGELPAKVKWKMPLSKVEKLTGLLDFDKTNIFIRKLVTEDYSIDFYFLDGLLHHLKITATIKTLKDHSKEIVTASGIRLLPDGGGVEGNVLDGTGTMRWGDGAAMYQGEWSYGLPHGVGMYVDSFGNKYEGEFKLGYFWGEGKFFSKAYKYSYSGNYVMSKKHGLGKISYSNRTAYEGDWLQDMMHGEGEYVLGSNYNYKGSMSNNSFNGRGVLTTPDGFVEGRFQNGKPNGICKQSTLDGNQFVKGNFVNGVKNGEFVVSTFGEIKKVKYENDIEIATGPVDPEKLK